MKRVTLIAASFIFAALFAVSASAQAPATPTGKIGLVNTYAFGDDKAGITKYRTAIGSLENEFKPVNDELKTLGTKYQTLGTEIQNLQKSAAGGSAVPVNTTALQAKIDEFQTLELTIKRKQEDAKKKYENRYQAVVGPIYGDIVKAMNDFAKQKGYAIILDGAKLEESGLLIGFDDKYDVTKDFVTFYNARPAGTATTATPGN
ncbi:MAG TPA: OmpH family outer membrane protein [Pyrinomonadaceae bacterium]|nr:OmpH family outer membrane protein [Pyrinomonadaceae bacterium]